VVLIGFAIGIGFGIERAKGIDPDSDFDPDADGNPASRRVMGDVSGRSSAFTRKLFSGLQSAGEGLQRRPGALVPYE